MWKGTPTRARYSGSTCGGKSGLLLVEVHRHQLVGHRRALLAADQQVEQGVTVLAARDADHDLVAGLDHVEVGDRCAKLAVQALGELVGFEGRLLQCGRVLRGVHGAVCGLEAEDFDADRLAVGVDVGLLGRHPRGLDARVREHQAQHVVGQRFLQVDMALLHAQRDRAADEVVVDHLVEFVGPGCRQGQRHVEVDVDQHALLAALFEVVHADVDPDLVVAQEQAPAVHQRRVGERAVHGATALV